MHLRFIWRPLRVHTTWGRGLPLTLPSKRALPPCANRALRKICSKTGGEAPSAGLTAMFFSSSYLFVSKVILAERFEISYTYNKEKINNIFFWSYLENSFSFSFVLVTSPLIDSWLHYYYSWIFSTSYVQAKGGKTREFYIGWPLLRLLP